MSDLATLQQRLEQRLANLRSERERTAPLAPSHSVDRFGSQATGRARSEMLARRLARALGAEHVRSSLGSYVRVDGVGRDLPLDRERLARLPGQPPADVPLVCLDTETTGLATAVGTFVFLVGLGRWQGDRFEQTQLLLPDQSDECAFLAALEDLIPPDGWLVTYNGRSFDWPLLVARYRMAQDGAPHHAGHLDLLPFVRRIFRHRLPDTRLRTIEQELLGVRRHVDIDGREIPGRYLEFLRGGPAERLADVVRHNDEDVRSLARLLAHVADRLGDPIFRQAAHRGDLAGLARVFHAERRHDEALDCLDAALAVPPEVLAPRRERDLLVAARARTLRRLGRDDEAFVAWQAIATSGGPLAAVGWIEVAKALEHRRHDPTGALEATEAAACVAERARLLGRPLHLLEADVARRRRRLRARLARRHVSRETAQPSRATGCSPRFGTAWG